MIAAALTFIHLIFPAPITWSFDYARPTTVSSAKETRPQSVNPAKPPPVDSAASVIRSPEIFPAVRLISDIGSLAAREIAHQKLVNEIVSYRVLISHENGDLVPWNPGNAIDRALALIESLPFNVPLPKPMLLSEQVAVYWDFGDAYAEIDFDGSIYVDAYGKRPGLPEVCLDRHSIVDARGGVSFPAQLVAIISNPEGLAAA